ncbi:MAG: hydroxylamine reductase [Anaerolineae bacterium]
MFCYQCEEAARGTGCTVRGVCGKTAEVAALQDLLIYVLKGLSVYGQRARALGLADTETGDFIPRALFATITNASFDPGALYAFGQEALARRDALRARFEAAYRSANGKDFGEALPEAATWQPRENTVEAWIGYGAMAGIMADAELDDDRRSLRELLIIGLKGMAAYYEHASVLGKEDAEIVVFMQEALATAAEADPDAPALLDLVMRAGQMGVRTMALLDAANTETYGHPEPTQVNLGVRDGPGILVSGHDLRDFHELLEQSKGTGVNIYTHGEMLPANAYPVFKKYDHLVGNYGGSWWRQGSEFDKFNGAILMTTNCLVPPRAGYKDRLYTTGVAGWPDAPHIADRVDGQPKDFGPVIARALQCKSPEQLEQGTLTVGFAHETVLGVADKVIAAIQSGALKRFVVMAGCDGRHSTRSYFTDVANRLPADSIILTAGCAKYRYNKLALGDIGGIPRVLDAGQCNDSYSLVVVALKLAEALGIQDVNELPIEYDIAWYEQKAVIVLLALLSLGVKHIRLGPVLPAFVSPGVLKVLVDKFDLRPITTVEEDLASIVAGH